MRCAVEVKSLEVARVVDGLVVSPPSARAHRAQGRRGKADEARRFILCGPFTSSLDHLEVDTLSSLYLRRALYLFYRTGPRTVPISTDCSEAARALCVLLNWSARGRGVAARQQAYVWLSGEGFRTKLESGVEDLRTPRAPQIYPRKLCLSDSNVGGRDRPPHTRRRRRGRSSRA